MPENEHNGAGHVFYAMTQEGYVPIGKIRDVTGVLEDEKERADFSGRVRGSLNAAEVLRIQEEKIVELIKVEELGKPGESWGFKEPVIAEEMQELITQMIDLILPELQIAFTDVAEGLCGLMEQIGDYIGYEYDGLWENLSDAKELAEIRREEAEGHRELQRRFERENRAKMKRYNDRLAGCQRSRRTGKRYREWRGPAR